jgi:hypothetical protein
VRAVLLAAATGFLLVLALPLALVAGTHASHPETGGPAPGDIPADLVPIYRAAATAYDVPWLLLASIHDQETNFSTLDAPGVRSGANGCGAAGPMQFGIVGVEPYGATAPNCGALTGTGAGDTWRTYRDAVAQLDLAHLPSEHLASCDDVAPPHGCVYRDADAIAAAASYLHDLGAGSDLDDHAWQAARAYNGAPAYADAVMARARAWATQPSAAAPADAPKAVAGAIAAADEISDRPYALQHWATHIDNPSYDCSSATSHVLWGAGVFGTAPWVSGDLAHYGDPGPGRWITVYANTDHAFIVVAGRRFDTARYDTGPNRAESGPRWREGPRPTAGFAVRHPKGL